MVRDAVRMYRTPPLFLPTGNLAVFNSGSALPSYQRLCLWVKSVLLDLDSHLSGTLLGGSIDLIQEILKFRQKPADLY